MARMVSDLVPCPHCHELPKYYVRRDTGQTGFACNAAAHAIRPECSEPAPTLPAAIANWNAHVANLRRFPRLSTLMDLVRASRLLEIGCFSCGMIEPVPPSWTGLALDLTISDAADQLSCSRCGLSNGSLYHFVYARPARRGWR